MGRWLKEKELHSVHWDMNEPLKNTTQKTTPVFLVKPSLNRQTAQAPPSFISNSPSILVLRKPPTPKGQIFQWKIRGPVKPPFFKIWLEVQPPPHPSRDRVRVVHTYELFPDRINRNHLDLILGSHGRNCCTMENLRELLCCKCNILMKPCEIARNVF